MPKWMAVLAAALTACASPPAAEALDEEASYPEGPAVVGGALYWAEMPADRIRRHHRGHTQTVWHQAGCGPTSIKPDGRGGFWILCHLADRVLRVDSSFKVLRSFSADSPNDATSDREGRLYFTSSGRFDLHAPAEGAVYFIDLQDRIQRLAGGLRYANGIHLDEARSRLFVSEHLQRRVLVGAVHAPGKVDPLKPFFDLNTAPLSRPTFALAGPDGLLVERGGSLLVAEYGAGRVLQLSPQGSLQRVIPVPMRFVTNFAFWPERDRVVVTGALHRDSADMPGRVIDLPR